MKYIVKGKADTGQTVYWNADRKSWYLNEYDATVYDDVNKADTACYVAETTIAIECVTDITFVQKQG